VGRLRRFPDHRFVGDRETMRVFDCDDEAQFDNLESRAERLAAGNLLQTFGPDTLDEARNRGFAPRGRAR
jgi:hypothetical protein